MTVLDWLKTVFFELHSRFPEPLLPALRDGRVASRAVAAPPVSLATAVQAAYEHNPERPVADVIRKQGEAIREQAFSLLAADPSLMVRHENDGITGDDGYRYWEGGLAMPLWLPGQRDQRKRVADATLSEADATALLRKWLVAGEVRELLWSLHIVEAELGLARRAADSARQLEADVERRVRAGALARTDLILAQKETLAQQIEQTEVIARRDALLGRYRLVTGLDEYPKRISETPPESDQITDEHPGLVAARIGAARASLVTRYAVRNALIRC
jgi:outer membrane protein TolC